MYAINNHRTLPLRLPPPLQHLTHSICRLCGRQCNLPTHKAYLERTRHQGHHKQDVSKLLSTNFSASYTFNPLTVAIQYVCSKLDLGFDPNDLAPNSTLPATLHRFIACDINANVPFVDPAGNRLGEVASDYLVATVIDELACVTNLYLWLMIEWTNTKRRGLERFHARLGSSLHTSLRESLDNHVTASLGTIFAIANHFATCLIFFDQSDAQREIMISALAALVEARGGFECLADSSLPGLTQILLWDQVMYCYMTGARPRFKTWPPGPIPPSLIPDFVSGSNIPAVYYKCCAPDLLETAKYLRLFLRYRHGTEARALSKHEFQYLVALERNVHNQLLDQTARHHKTDTMDECIALCMAVVRMNVLCIWGQHVRMRSALSGRLLRALKAVGYAPWLDSGVAEALIWVCWVYLAQAQSTTTDSPVLGGAGERIERIWQKRNTRFMDDVEKATVVEMLVQGLKAILGHHVSRWSHDWPALFEHQLAPLLWHSDYVGWTPHVVEVVDKSIAN